MQTHTNSFDSFAVGDPVHWSAGSHTRPGIVVRVTKSQIVVQEVSAELLNPIGSDEPDALQFFPGGFCGHTSGRQRYAFGEPDGYDMVFTRRRWSDGAIAKMRGTSSSGSMRSWGILQPGHAAHYDFNF